MKSTTQRKEREKKGWEEDRMKNRRKKKEKRVGIGTDPVHCGIYMGILVTSATTGHGGSVVSALASQAKGRGSILVEGTFFPISIFYLPFPTSVE